MEETSMSDKDTQEGGSPFDLSTSEKISISLATVMTAMANKAFYQQKAVMFCHLLNPENGRVSKARLGETVDMLCTLLGTPPGDTAYCKTQFTKWSDILMPGKEQEGVSAEEYADLCWGIVTDPVGRERYKLHTVDTYSALFDVIDTDKDRKVSRDELGMYYKACGVDDKQFVEKVFRELDEDQDGYVTREEFTKAALTYWYDTDPRSGYEFMYTPPIGHGKTA